MLAWLTRILLALRSVIEARGSREAEILVLRQQLLILNRASSARLRLWNIDRLKLVWLSRLFPSLLDAIIIVKPDGCSAGTDVAFERIGAGGPVAAAAGPGSIPNSAR